jgi:hypothetical protein
LRPGIFPIRHLHSPDQCVSSACATVLESITGGVLKEW